MTIYFLLLALSAAEPCMPFTNEPFLDIQLENHMLYDTATYMKSLQGTVLTVRAKFSTGLFYNIHYTNSTGTHRLQTLVPWKTHTEIITDCD